MDVAEFVSLLGSKRSGGSEPSAVGVGPAVGWPGVTVTWGVGDTIGVTVMTIGVGFWPPSWASVWPAKATNTTKAPAMRPPRIKICLVRISFYPRVHHGRV